MATLPITYTESEIKEYMQMVLGDTANKLGFSVGGNDFDEPTREVLYVLEKNDFTFVTTRALAAKVRMVARVEAWRAAMYYTVHESSFSAGAPGTGQTSRSEIHRQAKAMFKLVESEMIKKYPELENDVSRETKSWSIDYTDDYYGNANDS